MTAPTESIRTGGFTTTGPALATLLLDDAKICVTRYDLAPGAEIGWHRHGHDYVITMLTDGTMGLAEPDGSRTVTMSAGTTYRRAEGVEHNVFNVGSAPMSFIEFEIKR